MDYLSGEILLQKDNLRHFSKYIVVRYIDRRDGPYIELRKNFRSMVRKIYQNKDQFFFNEQGLRVPLDRKRQEQLQLEMSYQHSIDDPRRRRERADLKEYVLARTEEIINLTFEFQPETSTRTVNFLIAQRLEDLAQNIRSRNVDHIEHQ